MKLYLKEFHHHNLGGRRISIRDDKGIIKAVGVLFPDRPTDFPGLIAEKIKKIYGSTVGEWDKDGAEAKIPASVQKQIESWKAAHKPVRKPGAKTPKITPSKKKDEDEEEIDTDKENLTGGTNEPEKTE